MPQQVLKIFLHATMNVHCTIGLKRKFSFSHFSHFNEKIFQHLFSFLRKFRREVLVFPKRNFVKIFAWFLHFLQKFKIAFSFQPLCHRCIVGRVDYFFSQYTPNLYWRKNSKIKVEQTFFFIFMPSHAEKSVWSPKKQKGQKIESNYFSHP
jgi:hypothetical protein